jgi:hypothetical protein
MLQFVYLVGSENRDCCLQESQIDRWRMWAVSRILFAGLNCRTVTSSPRSYMSDCLHADFTTRSISKQKYYLLMIFMLHF